MKFKNKKNKQTKFQPNVKEFKKKTIKNIDKKSTKIKDSKKTKITAKKNYICGVNSGSYYRFVC